MTREPLPGLSVLIEGAVRVARSLGGRIPQVRCNEKGSAAFKTLPLWARAQAFVPNPA
jgi:hypothetical protein